MIKDAIEQGKEMEKENWHRVTIKNGKMEEYTNGEWLELETESSNDSNDSSWKLPRCTAVWIFGIRGKYNASIYRDFKILEDYVSNLRLEEFIDYDNYVEFNYGHSTGTKSLQEAWQLENENTTKFRR